MKKITLLLIAFLVTSFGFAQTELITNGDFSNDKTGWAGSEFVVQNGEAYFATTNAGGNPWDTQLTQANMNFTQGNQYVLKFKARAAAARKMTVAIQNVNVWDDQFRMEYDLTTTMTEFTATFNSPKSFANVQIGFLMAATGSTDAVYFDDISIVETTNAPSCSDGIMNGDETGVDCGGSCPNACPATPEPSDAPAAPTKDAADVISIYSEAYTTNIGVTNVEWDASSTSEEMTFANNKVLKVSFDDFLGLDFNSEVDASAMTHLHMDIWIADVYSAGQVIKPTLSNHNGSEETDKADIQYDVTANDSQNWVSIDVPFSSFTNLKGNGADARANLKQFLIVVASTLDLLYVDNIYFYKDDSGSGGGGGGDITIAAPDAPSFNAASDYSSVYSGLGSATGIVPSAFAGASISEVTIGGNPSTKIEVPTGGGGGQFAFAPIDLVAGGFTHVYFNYFFDGTLEAGRVINYNIQGGGANIGGTEALPSSKSVNQSWGAVNVALADLNNAADPKNAISQIQFTMAGGSNPFGNVYIDNVIFYKAGTASVNNNDLLGFSMYPNPVRNVLNISAAETIEKAEIFNVLGKRVMSTRINNTRGTVDVSELSSGIYLIKYNVNDKVGTAKFIKQ